ncbi:b-zip transcription factor [Rhizophagus clarus]|uniref:B-zip transcription factor n=1 Tax=Rhizophagus clarus TaxID=94130 RepID=A0A8H3QHS6_9GLOM|nr:b-zip transcription factor [Rhizophagus clarus]
MNMDVSGQQSTSSQSLKLPIPRLSTTSLLTPNTKFPDMLIPNNWTQQTQLPITLPTTCQPMLTSTSSMGKPAQNKRGRKPLSKMPETKKHIQNLTNQRAFRRRREDYVRTLETKAATYELLYNEAQNDIKMLRDRLTLLERRLNKAQTQGNQNDKLCNTSVYQESDTPGDTTMNNCTYDGNRLSAITPNTMSSFSFNEQRYQQKPGSPTKSVESVEDIINNPVFCETKEGDLCFCETVEFSVDNMEKEQSQLPPTEQSQWPSQQPHENYLPSPSPIEPSPPNYTQHHPLNLGSILGDHHSDESSDDSAKWNK